MKNNVQLKNFKQQKDGDFVYRTGEIGDVIEVEVTYDNGSMRRSSRGIWVRVGPMTYTRSESGNLMKSFTLCSGLSVMIERLERSKPSALLAAAAKLDHDAIALAALFIVDKNEAKAAIRELYGIPAPVSAAPPQYVPAGGGQ